MIAAQPTATKMAEETTSMPPETGGEVPNEEQPETEQEPAPAPAPAPRKTWAVPKAPPKTDNETDPIVSKEKKKSLLEIMEEEQRKEKETKLAQEKKFADKLQQEEEEALMKAMQASMATTEAGQPVDTMDEDLKLALMLSMKDAPQNNDTKLPPTTASSSAAAVSIPPAAASGFASIPPAAAAAAASSEEEPGLTEEELKEIEKALQEADAAENSKTDAESLKLALELQNEEKRAAQKKRPPGQQGNVRTMNRDEFLREQGIGLGDDNYDDNYRIDYDDDDGDGDYDDMDDNGATEAGFRINSTKPSPWSRSDRATIVGPNKELRTKHDPKLQGQTNAYRLELRADDETGERAHVGNKAFNAFHRSMQKKTVKGVAAHGHGRATADADKTREGALDGRVRLQIARAVNNGLIETFHGCVKEGKEALVFHAQQGSTSEGFDVAVKVFKRISEFKNRGEYVANDPRYGDGKDFRHAGQRQQLEQWAEKEHRNLIRAWRAKVPVPKPLWQKENVLFLRFLGEGGWPAPQLRELDIKKGSNKWNTLYEQTMEAMQLLNCDARLVHGDLSEYNIMVCPRRFMKRLEADVVATGGEGDATPEEEMKPAATSEADQKMAAVKTDDNLKPSADSTKDETEKTSAESEADDEELQIVLIDFGQAVDLRHPASDELLRRDVTRVKQFFDKMGITTIDVESAMAYVQTKGASLR